MKRRVLRHRYGRALPHSRLSLADYERALTHALHYLKLRDAFNEEERMMRLRGWEEGKKPITVALAIERRRKANERARR